ncbi:MAG: Gfo/Idh/MocA family oxidoreductase [Thermoplasmata archaeon]
MKKINFAIVGGGWRTQFYLRVVKALPEYFEISGITVRDETKGAKIEEQWKTKTYRTIEKLIDASVPEFIVAAVPRNATPSIIKQLVEYDIPVLSETPPASDINSLIEINGFVKERCGKVQIAEQYHLQPLHAARISLANSGKLGEINEVYISVCHDYHAMSLMRKLLKIGFQNCTITAHESLSKSIEPDNYIDPEYEKITDPNRILAYLDFEGKIGIYDFAYEQYFSWIRLPHLLVRGSKGEIFDDHISYLKDFKSPLYIDLKRQNAGENGNLKGYYLKGILAGEEWIYKNTYAPARLSDDEIAIASCLEKMDEYVRNGKSFYDLAEASQDHYLSLMIYKAIKNKAKVITEKQPWVF